jgi:hypothetical protein
MAIEITTQTERGMRGVGANGWTKRALLFFAMMVAVTGALAAAPAQKSFPSPEEASSALVQAAKAHDRAALLAVLGDVADWIGSGDAVADRSIQERFVAAYEARHSIARDANGDSARLVIGENDHPFAFPIVKQGEKWRFDSAAGKEELLARRIGENELSAIKVLQAMADAQWEYASEDRDGDRNLEYARKVVSSPGKRDGLYWPVKAGEPPSPLGELLARAASEGYRRAKSGPTPFHGYYFKLLEGQGKNAESGAFDYVVRGRAIGGFAALAYPAKYGNSGIMTFLINQDGKIFEADLGPQTGAKASAMKRFDPGKDWSPVAR